jgi:hypothetical protein
MNENTFKEYVYENICQCPEQCLLDNYQITNQSNCKEILPFYNINNIDFYDDKINEIINFFISSNILIKVGNKYYIETDGIKLKLSWDNIKTLYNDNIKKLLWLFRKCIVDLLLKKIINLLQLDKKVNFKIYSVGSNNLSSDYDITLYGDTTDKGNVITLFEKEFKNIFFEHSSVVFDTNLYGKSFISFEKNDLSTEFICNNDIQPIYILKKSSEHSQLVWALVKYFQDIRNAFGESIFNNMVEFLNNNITLPHINIAFETRIYLNNKDPDIIQYNKLFSQNFEKGFIQTYSSEELLQGTSDYISLLNFYGNETYFTRGAFLDIVINTQMCKNKIKLDDIDYITSILENSGFFFLHNNKTKYFIRVVNTLYILFNTSDKYKILEFSKEYEQVKKILDSIKTVDENDKISYDEKYCKWIDEKTFDLLKCEKYTIFNLLLKINYEILKIYSYFYDDNIIKKETFPFYYKFVKSDTVVFGKKISRNFSSKKTTDSKSNKNKQKLPILIENSKNFSTKKTTFSIDKSKSNKDKQKLPILIENSKNFISTELYTKSPSIYSFTEDSDTITEDSSNTSPKPIKLPRISISQFTND